MAQLTARDIAPVMGSTVLSISNDDATRSTARIATSMGAHLGRSPRGNMVVTLRVPDLKLDQNCVYPIINGKTGGHMRTFAGLHQSIASRPPRRIGFTGLTDANSGQSAEMLAGDVLLELSLQPVDAGHTRLGFWSNCIAGTEIGRALASSTGKFERAFLGQLAPGLNLDVWTTAAFVTADAPAEVEYQARLEFAPNDIHRGVVTRLHPSVSDRTLVKSEMNAKLDDVWRAAQRATRRFAELTSLTVMRSDERFHQIQNGDASLGGGERAWRDDFTTTISDTGYGLTRITVVRRLQVPSSDGLTWHGYLSDGERESWLIGAIMKDLATPEPAR
jgi:hypothetical protein